MSDWKIFLTYGTLIVVSGYFVAMFIFDLLLRGFAPFLPSRPWVIRQILDEFKIEKKNAKMVAFSSGRSGVFYALEKKYPDATFIGIESDFFPYLVAKVQQILRRTKMKVRYEKIRRVDVKDADLVYCHMDPDQLRELGSKFKFECKTGTLIISTGFNIPYLDPIKIVPLEDRTGKLDFLSRNQNLFQSKYKKYKKEKKAYFYQI
jgi:hypothetical protein